ncbi:MAG TPA: head GIN domain-containing protein [Actinomycetota bacterium]|nr:head GIN domain-containing protein [Actinomycetota bacterium]
MASKLRSLVAAVASVLLLPACIVFTVGGGDGSDRPTDGAPAPSASASFGGGSFNVRGNGNVRTEQRQVSGFDRLRVNGAAEVHIDQTGTESLTVEAEENLLPLLVSEVEGGRLTLGVAPNSSISATRPIVFRLTVDALREIDASGAGTIEATNVDVPELAFESSGTVNTVVSGSAATQQIDMSGAGRFDGRNLRGTQASVDVSGTAEAVVNVSDRLEASASGTGSVRYAGSPQVSREVSGVGRVEPLE